MENVLLTAVLLGLVAVPAVLVPTLLGIRGRAPWAAAVLVTGAADVVACTTALSVPSWWTRPGLVAAHALVAAVVVALWWRAGRPALMRLRRPAAGGLGLSGAGLAMVAVAGVALLVELYLVARVAPSNWDSMTYHLSRAAYWIQEDAVGYFANGSIRQLGNPPNAEILLGWTMLANGTDRWVELVQWISLVGTGLVIFSGARMLRFDPGPSAFAAGLFMILPQPVLQATTTQNDLVVSFFIGAAGLFLIRALRDRSLGDAAIGSAALGLALGTKGTAFIALPALAILAAGGVLAWRPPGRFVAITAALALVGTAGLAAPGYIQNYRHTQDVFGGVSEQVGGSQEGAWRNAAYNLWNFADSPGIGIPWMQPAVEAPVKAMFEDTFGKSFDYSIDNSAQEDVAAFGLVGFLLFFPLLLVVLLGPRSPRARRLLALAAIVFVAVFSFRIAATDFKGRNYVPMVALAAPLFAGFARRGWTGGLVGALGVLTLVSCLLQNSQKQLLVSSAETTVLGLDRIEQMTRPRPEMETVIREVQGRMSPGGALGFVGGEDSWDYPFFGPHMEHEVRRLRYVDGLTTSAIAQSGLDGVLFANTDEPKLESIALAPGYYWVPAAP